MEGIKTVLIIGGAGYIGSQLVRILLERNYTVIVLDLFIYGKESLSDVENKITLIKGDIRNLNILRKAIKGVDAVVLLAEIVGDPACSTCPELAESINFNSACQVARVSKEMGVKKFIYTSSCSVYGLSKMDDFLTEKSPLNPISSYAQLKIQVEKYLNTITDNVFQPTILRLATVYGLSSRPRFDLVVNILTAHAVVEKEITIKGGNEWRPFIFVTDVGKIISKMLTAPQSKVGGKIFNVGHKSQNHRISEIGEIVMSAIPGTQLITLPQKDIDKRSYRVDFNLLQNTIGFTPSQSVKDAVVVLKEYLLEYPDYSNECYSNFAMLKKYSCDV